MAVLQPGEANRASYLYAPVTVSVSTTTAVSAKLTKGATYMLTSSVDCFFLGGGSSIAATTSSNPLWARTYLGPLKVETDGGEDAYVAAITSSGSGTLYLIRVS